MGIAFYSLPVIWHLAKVNKGPLNKKETFYIVSCFTSLKMFWISCDKRFWKYWETGLVSTFKIAIIELINSLLHFNKVVEWLFDRI